jgi:prepilin peptidase CpaA
MIAFLSVTAFPVLMILAGTGDVLSMRIPNWLTLGLAVLFFPMALAIGMPALDIAQHVGVGIAVFLAGFALFSLGLFGGGDAKLLAAAGLWLGWPHLLAFLVVTAFAGGALALVIGLWSLVNLNSEIGGGSFFRRFGAIKPNVPYGYALAIGAIVAFADSGWVAAGAA